MKKKRKRTSKQSRRVKKVIITSLTMWSLPQTVHSFRNMRTTKQKKDEMKIDCDETLITKFLMGNRVAST